MRINSLGLRLNYSTSWNNRLVNGRVYNDVYSKSLQLNNYLNSLFLNKKIKRRVIIGNTFFKFKHHVPHTLLRVYIPVYKKCIDSISFRKRFIKNIKQYKRFKNRLKKYIRKFVITRYLRKLSYLISKDLNIQHVRYTLVRSRLFTASLISLYIVNNLLNKFKLKKILTKVKKDLISKKNKRHFMISCSGRFDRKQRASNYRLKSGRVSPSTLSNRVSYIKNEVTLKYGICGIKVWVLK